MTLSVGPEAEGQTAARRAAQAERVTGSRSGRSRAVSLETLASPHHLMRSRTSGLPELHALLTSASLGFAEERRDDSGRNQQASQLRLPMQHLIFLLLISDA